MLRTSSPPESKRRPHGVTTDRRVWNYVIVDKQGQGSPRAVLRYTRLPHSA